MDEEEHIDLNDYFWALDGMPPLEYFWKKRGYSDETLIDFTFS